MSKNIQLKCQSKDNKVFDCILQDASNESIKDPSSTINLDYIGQVSHENNSQSNVIGGIFFSALIGGFGFAIAYLLLYELYDWISLGDAYTRDLWRFGISMLILIALLFITIIIPYYVLKIKANKKKELHNSPEFNKV